ncbi:hypothetical protein GGF37_001372 [Kickxella alabastrina]|nr:hypothetical protein GGF37_001372 [Kickxella alabastrina]
MLRISSPRAATASTLVRHHSTTTATGAMFAKQGSLPRLPIPSLKDTATRYLRSLEPLLSPSEHAQSTKAASAFIGTGGLGPVLQQRLREVDRQAEHSWLEDIWVKKAYLEWRGPSYINVNWFAQLGDNPDYAAPAHVERGQVTGVQIQRAARVVTHMLELNEMINARSVPVDSLRGEPLCMAQFMWQFGTTRVPRPGCDQLVHQFPATARHILVMYRTQAVEVPVYNASGQRASLAQITAQLAAATQRVDKLIARAGAVPSVANLTAAHRDQWTRARTHLERDAGNHAALESADRALFGLSLDTDVNPEDMRDDERRLAVFAHSDGGANRWFDKAIQLVVLADGRLGVNCEHAPVDALTTGRILMEVAQRERGPLKDLPPAADLPPPEPLVWNVSPETANAISQARAEARALATDLRVLLGGVGDFGARWIKTLGVSPDAFFQVALQAAYLRHHGQPAATYESASLRRFAHGRTETIRSCTADAQAFARALDDPHVAERVKLELFRRAAATHTQLTAAATAGQGVDRHLLGLRAQLKSPEEAERAELFVDPAFAQSSAFVLSTSNTTPGDMFRGGFAPVVAGGYGINYAMDRDDIKFSISDWRPAASTDAPAFKETIKRTLVDLYAAGEHVMSK